MRWHTHNDTTYCSIVCTLEMHTSLWLFMIGLEAVPMVVSMNNSRVDWVNVDQTPIFQDLNSCAQSCVRDVNQKIFVDGVHCQSTGCVCSESTHGQNFLDGLANVTACAKQECGSDEAAEQASVAFQDLCLVASANSTRPETTTAGKNITRVTADGYDALTECAKFALNGCLDEDGNRTETKCNPINKPEHWEEYRGLAAQRQCTTPECLCKTPDFNATFATLYEAGARYCGMVLSTQALPIPEYDAMQDVLAMYCASVGYPPKSWWLRLVGSPRGSNESNETENNSTQPAPVPDTKEAEGKLGPIRFRCQSLT
ncbi:hypothetical protein P154DRAFT_21442 [Amniculicola lignicola CBS 123094]|uniref:Uncharacterized protein n=1 Tax=Amniculicola lignicola CBS 123094 TaxID=1392246 RepID=A0A6A5WV89_9PLEO|nr:hypothetical protein P154DRAFT_21442 [Amniculicola lignicola CBS 123094]